MSTKIIVALDFDDADKARHLVDQLDPTRCRLKIGKEMFTRFGPDFVKECIAKQFQIFLDLKFHDIPNTVANACRAAADLGVWMTNVHAMGGEQMMTAATDALKKYGTNAPLLIGVTILTSLSDADLPSIGLNGTVSDNVQRLALLAKKSGLDGVVCSAQEARVLAASCGPDFALVTPGIRLRGDSSGCQKRIMTPGDAISAGAHHLVIGRSITQAADPMQAIAQIELDIANSVVT